MEKILFFDTEIQPESGKLLDIGAVRTDGMQLHTASAAALSDFAKGYPFVCGHNIIAHDLRFVHDSLPDQYLAIDTLCLSPLLFPMRPYHALVKDDKLQSGTLNNPLNDAMKARELFFDEYSAYRALPPGLRRIYCTLLGGTPQFHGFFRLVGERTAPDPVLAVRNFFEGKICTNAPLELLIRKVPIELAYTLALIHTDDRHSVPPPWVLRNYPRINNVIRLLRGTPCADGCPYCSRKLDVRAQLGDIFGFDSFRTYNGQPLQENAARAAVEGKSLLAVFPTGGGKSITFQLPALMAGEASRGLTVVISPLQSLMKDQVDNLAQRGIADAVTINGLLSPIERAEAMERVSSGLASILYISPESLRSSSIERLLLSRNVVRFVIDEAHCFSAWGQDFRVDYLYIGDFIRNLQEKKNQKDRIAVSCFTATAKQKVISDICDYFKQKLDLELELFTTDAARSNLRYSVIYKENDDEKYTELRNLIQRKNCPTIVYVSRTKRTHAIARRLCGDGFRALPYNGKMDSADKVANQDAFLRDEVQIIVATSAFGMGVDKKDVGLVVHYEISDSLENYVQEAGRAGRDQSLQAECYVLFNEEDLDKHFILLNQTKLSMAEIQQVWKAIKDLTKSSPTVCRSALEIARQAGWDESGEDIETRVRTAIAALENAGYVERGKNMPRVYATSILVDSMEEAAARLDQSRRFDPRQKLNAKRIIKSLISSRSIAKAGNDDAESRVDYLADILGIDEAQDMDEHEAALVQVLMKRNEDMRIIAVGDDDQNIYEFRGSDSRHMKDFLDKFGAARYELLDNYRSDQTIVDLANAFASTIPGRLKTSPLRAVRTEPGTVAITRHRSGNLECAAVEELLRSPGAGSVCILTATNEEALRCMGLLLKHGLPARLIQTNNGFDLYDLAELRYFIGRLGDPHAPVITHECWITAITALCSAYRTSSALPMCLKLLETFASVNRTKYRTDLIEFIHESKLEDFIEDAANTILVSTMHKAKGREFDRVYLLLNRSELTETGAKRVVYVALTRARRELHVHYTGRFMEGQSVPGAAYRNDNTLFPEPEEIVLHLTHRDVVLDFFKSRKRQTLTLRSGQAMTCDGAYLLCDGRRSAKLSQKCQQQLADLGKRGYRIKNAEIRFIAAWKGENDTEETAILLPTLYLGK